MGQVREALLGDGARQRIIDECGLHAGHLHDWEEHAGPEQPRQGQDREGAGIALPAAHVVEGAPVDAGWRNQIGIGRH